MKARLEQLTRFAMVIMFDADSSVNFFGLRKLFGLLPGHSAVIIILSATRNKTLP